MSSEGLGYISMLLKLGTLYKPEDMYLKDFPIKEGLISVFPII